MLCRFVASMSALAWHRSRAAAALIGVSCLSLALLQYAKAEEARLKVCMNSIQKELGVSPDTAYIECSKRTVADCIKSMAGQKFVAMSVGRKGSLYIVDAGNDYTRWMEGGGWRAKGCEPYGEGPRRDSYFVNGWGTQKRTLFRQGSCPSEALQLDQVNTIHEAEVLCQHGTVNQSPGGKAFD